MAEIIKMPKMSDTMTEGVLAKWHKQVGDKLKSGELLAEIETDKATMDFECYQEGTLLYIGAKEGEALPVDALIAIIGAEGENFQSLLSVSSATTSTETPKAEESPKANETIIMQESKSDINGRIKASPLAKKIAEDKGIDLSSVHGSAEGGRIVKKDLENINTQPALNIPKNRTLNGEETFTEISVSQMRKTIAKRLSDSKFSAPHFYLRVSIDMDNAIVARNRVNELSETKISFNDFVIKAVATALRKHPNVNSSWLGDKIRYNQHINIGVAIAVEDGLLVPVVRMANTKSLSEISNEVKDFSQRAKNKKLQPSEWEGSTFTISNLGMFGIEDFTAIINPPDACILAVGGIQQVPVVRDGMVVAGNVMKVTLSCDHRVVDGATGATFLQTVKSLLEEPLRILV